MKKLLVAMLLALAVAGIADAHYRRGGAGCCPSRTVVAEPCEPECYVRVPAKRIEVPQPDLIEHIPQPSIPQPDKIVRHPQPPVVRYECPADCDIVR